MEETVNLSDETIEKLANAIARKIPVYQPYTPVPPYWAPNPYQFPIVTCGNSSSSDVIH